jgi:hypothetical protein
MFNLRSTEIIAPLLLLAIFSLVGLAGAQSSIPYKSQEVSETDGVPVLLKHLPEWETVRHQAVFANGPGQLEALLGERPILGEIEFVAGTEAVAAPYDAGKLVIVEYSSPQLSAEADARFKAFIAREGSSTAYRRIGNYNVLVLDPTSGSAAEALIDQVKYEKQIQWLGDNPFRISAERAFVLTTSDIFLSTVLVILMGIGFSLAVGIAAGYVYFRYRESRRMALPVHTDAGGMTRLNLDGLSADITSDRLLSD